MTRPIEVRSPSAAYEVLNGQVINYAVADGKALRLRALGCPEDIIALVTKKDQQPQASAQELQEKFSAVRLF